MTYNLYANRDFFEEDHLEFRDMVRSFVDNEIADHVYEWESKGEMPREIISKLGEQGILGMSIPEEYGGEEIDDYRYRTIVIEELARVGAAALITTVLTHCDLVTPYIMDYATEEQKQRWLPKMATGEALTAIAMTEPAAGSDLRGIQTTAMPDGDGWVLNGTKMFISNGEKADLVVVAARTPKEDHPKGGGLSLFVVEEGMEGFSRGKRLDKVGMHSQDTAELIFEDVRLTRDNLLGEECKGLHALMGHLPIERLSIAVAGVAGARAALNWTIDYVQERKAFKQRIADFQNTQFEVADMVTRLEVTQAFIDQATRRYNESKLTPVDAAKAKWWATENHKSTVDRCLQLFGGYGYMLEYPIARAFGDTRVTTIFGGTTEIMKLLIGREIFDEK